MEVELLLRVVDKIGATDYQDAGLTKSGDVIAIHMAPGPWGSEELTNPDWRIIRVDIPATLIDSLVAIESGSFAYRLNRKRIYQLNIDSLQKSIKDTILAPRDNPILNLVSVTNKLKSAVVRKADL